MNIKGTRAVLPGIRYADLGGMLRSGNVTGARAEHTKHGWVVRPIKVDDTLGPPLLNTSRERVRYWTETESLLRALRKQGLMYSKLRFE